MAYCIKVMKLFFCIIIFPFHVFNIRSCEPETTIKLLLLSAVFATEIPFTGPVRAFKVATCLPECTIDIDPSYEPEKTNPWIPEFKHAIQSGLVIVALIDQHVGIYQLNNFSVESFCVCIPFNNEPLRSVSFNKKSNGTCFAPKQMVYNIR